MAAKHSIIALQAGSRYLGRKCPVKRTEFALGEQVIICHEKDEVLSWVGWPQLDGRCPYCKEIVSEWGSVVSPERESVPKKKKSPEFVPAREHSGSITIPWRTIALALGLLLVCSVSAFAFVVLRPTSKPESTWTDSPRSTNALYATGMSEKTDTIATETKLPVVPVEQVIQVTPSQIKSPTPGREIVLRWESLGRSVKNREISMAIIGDERGTAVVILGALDGTQTNTRDLVDRLVNYYDRNLQEIPDRVTFYLIPAINPDGVAANDRYNANGADINRNWDTADWTRNPGEPGYPQGKPGAGGSKPFSEPETRALRDLLQNLERQGRNVQVIVLHSSVTLSRGNGKVFPGSTVAELHQNSYEFAVRFARVTGYNVETTWEDYTTAGEVVVWCAEQDIVSVDVVFSVKDDASFLQDGFVRAMLEAIR